MANYFYHIFTPELSVRNTIVVFLLFLTSLWVGRQVINAVQEKGETVILLPSKAMEYTQAVLAGCLVEECFRDAHGAGLVQFCINHLAPNEGAILGDIMAGFMLLFIAIIAGLFYLRMMQMSRLYALLVSKRIYGRVKIRRRYSFAIIRKLIFELRRGSVSR